MKNFFLECWWKGAGGIFPRWVGMRPTANLADIGTIKEILVILMCGIGDMVVFIPALETLSSYFCKSHISIMTTPHASQLLKNHPCVVRTFISDDIHQIGFLKRFDLVVNLSGWNDEINKILRNANVKHLIIEDLEFDKEYPFHASEYHFEFIKKIAASFHKPLVYTTDEQRNAARKYLINKKLYSEVDLIIAVHAGSSNPSKCWNWRRFVEVCNLLIENHGAKILLLSGPSEVEISDKIAKRLLVQPVVIKKPLGLVAALLEQCNLLISNDSGIMHLAAAVGTPVVSIFSASSSQPEIWGPLVDNHIVIYREAIDAISVDDVMRNVKILLSRTHE